MSSEEFFRTKDKMKGKTYTDLSELSKDIRTTLRKIDSIEPIAKSSDAEEIRKCKQPCQDIVFLETDGKKYAIALSSENIVCYH